MNAIAFARKSWWLWPLLVLVAAVLITRTGYISDSYEGFLVYPLIPIAFNPDIFMALTCLPVPALVIGSAIFIWLRKIDSPSLTPDLSLLFAFGCAFLTMAWSLQTGAFYFLDIDYDQTEFAPNGQMYYLTNLSKEDGGFDDYPVSDIAIILLECDSVSILCRKIVHANHGHVALYDFDDKPPQLYLYRNNTLSLKYGGETIFEKQLTAQ